MMQRKQCVTIKGTKEGLVFQLDEDCSYEQIIEELKEKLSSNHYHDKEGRQTSVNVDSGNRYLRNEQKEEIKQIITDKNHLVVEQFLSNVLTYEEIERLHRQAQTVTITRIIRSGQVLKVDGDVILIGDINPGGTLMATGNIYVAGALRGIAHAGCEGNERVVITAAVMDPVQLKIANAISVHLGELDEEEKNEERVMGAAYIEGAAIKFDRVQQLVLTHSHLQKNENQLLN